MKIIPNIETERLQLRGITESDTDLIVKWRSNPLVYRFFLSPHELTRQEHLNWFRLRYSVDENRYDWLALEKETNNPIGLFGLRRSEDDIYEAEVNYLLSSEAQGKGFAKEAVSGMIEWVKLNWNSKKIIAEIHCDNKPSIKLAENLRFEKCKDVGDFYIYTRTL